MKANLKGVTVHDEVTETTRKLRSGEALQTVLTDLSSGSSEGEIISDDAEMLTKALGLPPEAEAALAQIFDETNAVRLQQTAADCPLADVRSAASWLKDVARQCVAITEAYDVNGLADLLVGFLALDFVGFLPADQIATPSPEFLEQFTRLALKLTPRLTG
jgi:hypothetical protein